MRSSCPPTPPRSSRERASSRSPPSTGPADRPDRRVLVGTWRTRADWEAWHHDPQFAKTRQRLDGLESAPAEHWWHDVVLDVRKPAAPPPPTSKSPSKRRAKGNTK